MNLVDSSGWVEYFVGGKQADQFSKPIEQSGQLIVPTVVIFEVFKFLARVADENNAWKAVSAMHSGQMIFLDVDISLQAAQISLVFKLPMADSMILATARSYNAIVWTQDADFKDIEGVEFIPKI
ncbi:MAG: type II toxin-antitoxin system VapC family toxin [Candidatus Moranbacteria bacterium]|nr:type II toxin-antitoxin system VapC family toxin [Candidatus Moranbacteria bacterium]